MPIVKPEVGQTIFAYDSMGRRLVAEELVVRRIGRDYFYATRPGTEGGSWEHQFHLDNWYEKVNIGSSRQAYTDEGWKDFVLSQTVRKELDDLGVSYNYGRSAYSKASLDQLCRIRDILREAL